MSKLIQILIVVFVVLIVIRLLPFNMIWCNHEYLNEPQFIQKVPIHNYEDELKLYESLSKDKQIEYLKMTKQEKLSKYFT